MAANIMDIRSDKWVGLILRLQRMGRTQHVNKCKLIRLTVICDEDGNPIIWSEPQCTPMEPGNGTKDWLNQL